VRVVESEGRLSERRACGLIGIARGSVRYRRRQRNEEQLWTRVKERFGYRRPYVLLRREKNDAGTMRWRVNHKRVYRLYREEGLTMRRKTRKRLRSEARRPLELPQRANHLWMMDFTHDSMVNGRKFRTLNLMDGYTREALAIEVDTSLPRIRVARVLERLKQERGMATRIVVDNGPEFLSRAVDQWAYEDGVEFHFIDPGKRSRTLTSNASTVSSGTNV
jgi:putative transposase